MGSSRAGIAVLTIICMHFFVCSCTHSDEKAAPFWTTALLAPKAAERPVTSEWLDEAIADTGIHPITDTYQSDFLTASQWFSYTIPSADYHTIDPYFHYFRPLETESGVATSSGPWWIDPNHRTPRAGNIHLVAFAFSRHIFGSPHTDMTDATVTLRIKGNGFQVGEGNLFFWVQGFSYGIQRSSNHALNVPIAVTDDWKEFSLHLSPSANWIPLGSSTDLEHEYGIADIEEILARTYDFGLIILPVNPANPATGEIEISSISIH